MNYDKIKELAEQAGYLPDMFNRGHWDMPECQKFAELIVRECVGVINDASVKALRQNTFMGDDVPSCIHESNILKHFGVE